MYLAKFVLPVVMFNVSQRGTQSKGMKSVGDDVTTSETKVLYYVLIILSTTVLIDIVSMISV